MADNEIVHLNLDTEERKGYPPYHFVVGGNRLTFKDPTELDWQTLEGLTTIDALAEYCMSDEDRKLFYGTPMAAYKLPILFDDVQRHFELGEYAKKIRR